MRLQRSWQIYTMNPDGTNQHNLTASTAINLFPAYSADGKKIAFTSNRDGNAEIYTMGAGGGSQTRLTNTATTEFGASWQPLP